MEEATQGQRWEVGKCPIEHPADPERHLGASRMETKRLCFTTLAPSTLLFCILTLGEALLYHSADMIKAVWRIAMVCGGQERSIVGRSEGVLGLINFLFLSKLLDQQAEKGSNLHAIR